MIFIIFRNHSDSMKRIKTSGIPLFDVCSDCHNKKFNSQKFHWSWEFCVERIRIIKFTGVLIFHILLRITPRNDIADFFKGPRFGKTWTISEGKTFSKCILGAINLHTPLWPCSESIARVGKNQKPVFPGLKPGFMFEKPGSELRWHNGEIS